VPVSRSGKVKGRVGRCCSEVRRAGRGAAELRRGAVGGASLAALWQARRSRLHSGAACEPMAAAAAAGAIQGWSAPIRSAVKHGPAHTVNHCQRGERRDRARLRQAMSGRRGDAGTLQSSKRCGPDLSSRTRLLRRSATPLLILAADTLAASPAATNCA
jgi:hypothetical protein